MFDPHNILKTFALQPGQVQFSYHATITDKCRIFYVVSTFQLPDNLLDRGFVFSIALKNIVLDGIAFKGSHHTNYNLFPFRPIVSAVAIFTDLTIVSIKKR